MGKILKKRYLLILSCSKRKKKMFNVSAIELYDGPFYRILRKHKYVNLDVFIISAKYGFFNSKEKISYYDQIMTPQRANKLADEVEVKLKKMLKRNQYEGIFINLGNTYLKALKKSKTILRNYNVYWAKGRIGERLHQFKNWLNLLNIPQ